MSRKKKLALVAVGAIAAIAIAVWALWPRHKLPAYVAFGNGRLEATEYDVATKVPGRLAELAPHEGDNVAKDVVVGRIAVEDLNAQLEEAKAKARATADGLQQAQASMRSAESQLNLARITWERSKALRGKGALPGDQFDRDRDSLQSAEAALAAARAKVEEARSTEKAARARVESVGSNVADAELKAPISGRVLFRLVEPGVVLPPGGKALTLLDLTDMYMTIFLPARQAGGLAIGSDARIYLDALPGEAIPARVSFVAARNQFTPKEVETAEEREKLTFRVKVQIEKEWLVSHAAVAKAGMPGVAYVRLAANQPWPMDLHGKAAE